MTPHVFRAAPLGTTIEIDARMELVWTVMIEMGLYGQWNPFIVNVGTPRGRAIRVGDDLHLHVRWSTGGHARSVERIVALEPPGGGSAHFAYRFRGPLSALGLVRGVREQRLERIEATRTRYLTSQVMTGLLVRYVPTRLVQDGFERQAVALKARAESLAPLTPA